MKRLLLAFGLLAWAGANGVAAQQASPGAASDGADAVVEGRVTAKATGEPLGGVHISADGEAIQAARMQRGWDWQGNQAQTDADGRYRLEIPPGKIMLRVIATPPGFKPTRAQGTLKPGEVMTHNIQLDALPVPKITLVEGVVRDARTNAPLPGVEIVITRVGVSVIEGATTNEDGRFATTAIKPGKRTVTLRHPDFASEQQTLQVKSGRNSVEWTLGAASLGTLTLVVTDRETGQPVPETRVSFDDRQLTSDVTGRLVVEKLRTGPLSLTAEADAYQPARGQTGILAGQTATLELALAPITRGTLIVQVTDAETGRPLPEASLVVGGGDYTTDDGGRVAIEPLEAGAHRLRASHPAYHDGSIGFDLARTETLEVVVPLSPVTTGSIAGRVVDAQSGAPIAEARVTAGGRTMQTDPQGAFLFDPVEAGTLDIAASASRYHDARQTLELARAAQADIRIELDPIITGTLIGKVVDAESGQPLPGARIALAGLDTTVDANGAFRFETVPAGRIDVSAALQRYRDGRGAVELPRAGEASITLALEPIRTGSLRVEVVADDTGAPIAGARVQVGSSEGTTDADGRWHLSETAAGTVAAQAAVDAYLPGRASGELERAGELALTIRLVPVPVAVARMEGCLAEATAGLPVSGARVCVDDRCTETGSNGCYVLDGLPTGAGNLSVRHPDFNDTDRSLALTEGVNRDPAGRLDRRVEDTETLARTLDRQGAVDLYGIYFDSGKDRFTRASLPTLNALVALIQSRPASERFEIAGHTDSDGSAAFNQDLSERRASTVIAWLIERGVAPDRLRSHGYGLTRPVAPNDTDGGKALNRRVELRQR
jgi:outer membrane protein OmpA-like peptidoglycan-associated protein